VINLVKQYNLTSIQKHLINCVKKDDKRKRIMAQLKAIMKKEDIYLGHDGVKEVRVVIGRHLAYSRCCPTDIFDVSRGVAMCICEILNEKTEKRIKISNVYTNLSQMPYFSKFPSSVSGDFILNKKYNKYQEE